MNPINTEILEKANEAALYNVYIYLAHKTTPRETERFGSIISGLISDQKQSPDKWNKRDLYQLSVLNNAIKHFPTLANSQISNLTRSKSGLTACVFTNPIRNSFVIYKGTGSGEWIDNGEGLSGISEENTYITYGKNGKVLYSTTVKDYATDQQVDALNWFNGIASANGWDRQTDITVSGHSKGGNKAQFVSLHSDLVNNCFSFDGQGFSPEALVSFKSQYGTKLDERRQKIYSFSADNDYVNVLGERLMPENHIYYFKSFLGLHYMEAMLNISGNFNPQSEQGKISQYVENISKELMRIKPSVRQYTTLGVMNIFQKYLGGGIPVNNDTVSIEKTIAGLAIAVSLFFRRLQEL